MTRQNYYKQRKERQRKRVDEEVVVCLVDRERSLQPRLGVRKRPLMKSVVLLAIYSSQVSTPARDFTRLSTVLGTQVTEKLAGLSIGSKLRKPKTLWRLNSEFVLNTNEFWIVYTMKEA